jgi:hypothetical protein
MEQAVRKIPEDAGRRDLELTEGGSDTRLRAEVQEWRAYHPGMDQPPMVRSGVNAGQADNPHALI